MRSSAFTRRALALAVFTLSLLSARAAEPLSLHEALQLAVQRAPLLRAGDAAALGARELAHAAGQLPDPVLKLGVDNLPVNGMDRFSLTRDFMTMRRVGVMQDLPSAEKRRLRADRLGWDAERARAERAMSLATVQRETALAWINRHYPQAMRELLLQQLQETRLQLASSESAFSTGRAAQTEVWLARGAVAQIEDRLSQVTQQERAATLQLARWIGPQAERPVAGAPPWQSSDMENGLTPEHLSRHPELALLQAQLGAAQAEARLASANRSPDWSVEASYSQRGPAWGNMVSVGVSVPLQWDRVNRQDRELAARLAQVEEAQARHEDALRGHEALLQGLISDWRSGKERLLRYQEQLLPLARQRSEAALVAYGSGKLDLAGVLGSRRDELEVRMQYLSLQMETARSWAALNFIAPVDTASPRKEQP